MFEMHGRTIRLSQGDTGVAAFRVEGVTLTDEDRGVFTLGRGGSRVLQKVILPEGALVRVPFVNEETDGLAPGLYEWDLRIVLGAKTDEQGGVTDGREVITPWPPSRLEVVKVVGKV